MIIERKFRNINKKVSLVPYNRPIISFRTMFKLASHQGVNIRLVRPTMYGSSTRQYAVHNNYRFKSLNSKKYATDGTGKHVMKTKTLCNKPDCDTKNCKTPCEEIAEFETGGHYTHFPPNNVSSTHLDNIDFQGKAKVQYYVKPSNSNKVPTSDLKEMTEDDMEPNKAADLYSQLPHIFPKVK